MAYGTYAAVTPNDGADLPFVATALWVGGAGNVAVVNSAGVPTTFVAVAAGATLPIQCKRVLNAGTTATLIIAMRDS
jgi:hypothetical protein